MKMRLKWMDRFLLIFHFQTGRKRAFLTKFSIGLLTPRFLDSSVESVLMNMAHVSMAALSNTIQFGTTGVILNEFVNLTHGLQYEIAECDGESRKPQIESH